jgi:hypothetical protein
VTVGGVAESSVAGAWRFVAFAVLALAAVASLVLSTYRDGHGLSIKYADDVVKLDGLTGGVGLGEVVAAATFRLVNTKTSDTDRPAGLSIATVRLNDYGKAFLKAAASNPSGSNMKPARIGLQCDVRRTPKEPCGRRTDRVTVVPGAIAAPWPRPGVLRA